MGEMINDCSILVRRPEGNIHLEDLAVDGEIILEWIFVKYDRRCGLDSSGSGQGPVASPCEHGNEPTGSIKNGEFVD
jgi:hypothetical protein